VEKLLEDIRPIGEHHASCIPSEWLLLVVVLDCEGVVELSIDEATAVARELSTRIIDLKSVPREPFRDLVRPEFLECLVSGTLPAGEPLERTARAWAWWLVAGLGAKGSFLGADEEVVATLRSLMDDWPIREDSWWEDLWSGLPDTPGMESVSIRVALFEALSYKLSEGEWLHRLGLLAGLEDTEAPGASASLSLLGMGRCLNRKLSDAAWLEQLAIPGEDNWRRALLMGFPEQMQWPAAGHADLPAPVRDALVDMRDSLAFPYRGDVLQKQWSLLGPEEAVWDLERFVRKSSPASVGWHWDAALRLDAALTAMRIAPHDEGTSGALMRARTLVREFIVSGSPADVARVLVSLRDQMWATSSRRTAAGAQLIDIAGEDALKGLPNDVLAWLKGS